MDQSERMKSGRLSAVRYRPVSSAVWAGRGRLALPNLVFADSPGVAGGLRHYNVWSCDILFACEKTDFCVVKGPQCRCGLKTECQ